MSAADSDIPPGWYPNPGGGFFAKTRYRNGVQWTQDYGDAGVGITWPDRSWVARTAPAPSPDPLTRVCPPYPSDRVADPAQGASPVPDRPGVLLQALWTPAGAVILWLGLWAASVIVGLSVANLLVLGIPYLWLALQGTYLTGAWNRWQGQDFWTTWTLVVTFVPLGYVAWSLLARPARAGVPRP